MKNVMSKTIKNCRWCGRSYTAARPLYKDGFCSQACKQAHHRAYQKYVTTKRAAPGFSKISTVTRKIPGLRRGMIKSKVI